MTEDEYWESDPEFDDEGQGEFGDTFLANETEEDEINMIIIPKLDFDVDNMLRGYLKSLKKCPSTDKAMDVLYDLYKQIQIVTTIENGIEELQFKADNFRELMKSIRII